MFRLTTEITRAPHCWPFVKGPAMPSVNKYSLTKVHQCGICFHVITSSCISLSFPPWFVFWISCTIIFLVSLNGTVGYWTILKLHFHPMIYWQIEYAAWWRHQMETFSALLVICAGNSPASGELPAQRPVTRSFDVFFDLFLNNGWKNSREAGDWRRYSAHYDVIVMVYSPLIGGSTFTNTLGCRVFNWCRGIIYSYTSSCNRVTIGFNGWSPGTGPLFTKR